MNKKRVSVYSLFTIIALIILNFQGSFSQETIPENISLTIYTDGYVFVDYFLIVNQSFPSQNITVFGQVLEDLIITDENGLPLGYFLQENFLTVYNLGSDEINLNYLTQDITSKDGRFWILTVSSPIDTRIILPLEATIVSLNVVPEIIETQNNRVTLQMPAGFIEITYVIGIIGNEEYTRIIIDETEKSITEIKKIGVIILEAEQLLEQSKSTFELGNYAEAEMLANEAKNLAFQFNQTASQASIKINEAQSALAIAEGEGRISGLDNSRNLINQAISSFEVGNYTKALDYANNAILEAENSTFFQNDTFESFPFIGLIFISLVSISSFIIFVFFKTRNKTVKSPKKKRIINSERIFKEEKNLIPEEKQAIQFLIDNNGEAFEADLYNFIKLPRTTTWRMVKRLKNMGFLTVTKFRKQNLVRIKTKYDSKE